MKNDMTIYSNVEKYYISQLVFLKNKYRLHLISEETFRELTYQNLRWFQTIVSPYDVCEKFYLDEEEVKKVCEENEERPRDYIYSLIYRGIRIDVFIDDYGQQEYAIFKINNTSHTTYGGSYNTYPWDNFCDEVDYQIETAYISGQIDEGELKCFMM